MLIAIMFTLIAMFIMDVTYIDYCGILPSNRCGNICRKTSPINVPNENAISLVIRDSLMSSCFRPQNFCIFIK